MRGTPDPRVAPMWGGACVGGAPMECSDNGQCGALLLPDFGCVDLTSLAPRCKYAIPTVSEWGLVILTLLLLAVGKICCAGRRHVVP